MDAAATPSWRHLLNQELQKRRLRHAGFDLRPNRRHAISASDAVPAEIFDELQQVLELVVVDKDFEHATSSNSFLDIGNGEHCTD